MSARAFWIAAAGIGGAAGGWWIALAALVLADPALRSWYDPAGLALAVSLTGLISFACARAAGRAVGYACLLVAVLALVGTLLVGPAP